VWAEHCRPAQEPRRHGRLENHADRMPAMPSPSSTTAIANTSQKVSSFQTAASAVNDSVLRSCSSAVGAANDEVGSQPLAAGQCPPACGPSTISAVASASAGHAVVGDHGHRRSAMRVGAAVRGSISCE